jgi:hypothetical protein
MLEKTPSSMIARKLIVNFQTPMASGTLRSKGLYRMSLHLKIKISKITWCLGAIIKSAVGYYI